MWRKRTRLLLFIFFLASSFLAAQQYIPLEEEAPEALFETQLWDADMELFLIGSWDLTLTGSFGFGIDTEDTTVTPLPFPTFSQGIIFNQVPDLTLSLWLLNRFFFETTFTEDSDDNTFLLGYRGKEDEFLQSVLIGNTSITMDTYSFLETYETPPHSLGGKALFKSDFSQHEVMVRYDPAEKQKKLYRGTYEIVEETIRLSNYEQGRQFLFPDADVADVEIYIEESNGPFTDGSGEHYYRKLEAGEAVISEKNGWVFFDTSVTRRVLVYYTKDGKEVGDSSLGGGFLCGVTAGELDPEAEPIDFSWDVADYLGEDMAERRVTVNGKECLLINEPGVFSPFELQNSYAVTIDLPDESWRVKTELIDKADLLGTRETVKTKLDREHSRVLLFYSGSNSRDPSNRYPLAGSFPFLYGPERETRSGYISKELRIEVLLESDGYYLEGDIIPGSITVKINGREEQSFDFDGNSGLITFYTYIHPEDRVEILYRTASQSGGGNLIGGIGNRFYLTPELVLDAAAGIKWNVLPNAYTIEAGENPGSVLATAGISYETDRFSGSLDTGVSFSTPDTTGTFRALGMENDGISVPITGNTLFPAGVPAGDLGTGSPYTVSKQNRGKLFYKDYNSYNVLGNSQLMPYTWDPPEEQIYSYSTGNPAGPYPARADTEEIAGTIMVIEYSLSESKPWTGAQIPLGGGGETLDLSSINSIRFKWKGSTDGPDPLVFFHIGKIDEDLDDDGILDSETTEQDSGFQFNDVSNGAILFVGGGPQGSGNYSIDSEDTNNNGVLDSENDDLIIKEELSYPGSNWKQIDIRLPESERNKLAAANALRFIIYNDTNEKVEGKLLVSSITLAGSSFKAEATGPGTVQAREITETDTLLEDSFPEVQETFHSFGSPQQVLEIDWRDIPDGGKWELTGYTNRMPVTDYRYARFYIRTGEDIDDEDADFSLQIVGDDNRGLHISMPLKRFTRWREVTVDRESEIITVDGETIEGGSVQFEKTRGTLSKIIISSENSTSGTLYIDELHLDTAFVQVSAGVRGTFEYTYPETILAVDSVPIVSNFRLKESVSLIGRNFATAYGETLSAATIDSMTETEATLFFTRIGANFGIIYAEENLFLSGGHRIQVPSVSSPVTFVDSYSETNEVGGRSFSRENNLIVSIPSLFSLRFIAKSSFFNPTLQQEWNGTFASQFSFPFRLELNTDFRQASSTFELEKISYFENWIKRYDLLVPVLTDLGAERGSTQAALFSLTTVPVGFELTPQIGYTNSGSSEGTQENSGEVVFSLPISIRHDTPFTWSITPSYKRQFSYTVPAKPGGSFGEDFDLFFETVPGQSYIYDNAPGEDLFSSEVSDIFESATDTLSNAYYQPEISITYFRNPGSYIRDLFIPSRSKLSFSRSLERVESNVTDTFAWQFSFRNTAINLFGSKGAYPAFSFYETEELTLSSELKAQYKDSTAPTDITLIIQNLWVFEGSGEHELILENRFSHTWAEENTATDDLTISYTWQKYPRFRLTLPFFTSRQEQKPFFLHTESLELSFSPGKTEDFDTAFLTTVRHETGLIFPEIGSIKGFASLGLSQENADLIIFGLQAGIEGHISF